MSTAVAGINALARQAGAEVAVVDIGCCEGLSALANEGKIVSKIVAGSENMSYVRASLQYCLYERLAF